MKIGGRPQSSVLWVPSRSPSTVVRGSVAAVQVQTLKARAKPYLRAIAPARYGRTSTLPDASRA